MMSIAALTALAPAVAVVAPASAQETGGYANGGNTHHDANDVTVGGVTGRLG